MAALSASRLVCSAIERMVPRIDWMSLLSRSSCCIDCADCSISRLNWSTLCTAASICCWPWRACCWPLSADSAAWLQERATSLAVATISWKAVDTMSTASRWRPAASAISAETWVELLEVARMRLADWPMCWIKLRIAARNWLNQLASCAVSSRPRTCRFWVRSPSPWAMPSRPLATLRIGRTIRLAKLAPTTAKMAASTAAMPAINQPSWVADAMTSSCLIRPTKLQPSLSDGQTLAI
ncbi:hypothetical protein D3C76_931680 [compost metagenome]